MPDPKHIFGEMAGFELEAIEPIMKSPCPADRETHLSSIAKNSRDIRSTIVVDTLSHEPVRVPSIDIEGLPIQIKMGSISSHKAQGSLEEEFPVRHIDEYEENQRYSHHQRGGPLRAQHGFCTSLSLSGCVSQSEQAIIRESEL